MIKRSSHRRRGTQQSKLARLAMLIILLATLSACSSAPPEEPPEKMISFTKDVLPGKTVLDVQRADTDSDGQSEWVVFYRFDQVSDRGPVAALIYDVVRDPSSQLPIVYPYRLRTPDQNYLALGQPKVALVDVVPEVGGVIRKELVFTTTHELTFFRLNHDPASQLTDDPPLYRCIGFFRSDGGVSFDPSKGLTVTVTSQAGYERSQLVTRYYYKPEADGYFITGTTSLVQPFASAIDFPEGIPSDILDTPYPEKIILAFYKTLGREDAKPKATDYLSDQATQEFEAGRLRYGSPYLKDQIKYAVVKELGYYPTQEDSKSTIVAVKVVFYPKSGERSPLIEVRWTLIRVQNRWKMDYPQP